MATPSRGSSFSDGVRIGHYQNKDFSNGVAGMLLSPLITYAGTPAANSALWTAGTIAAAGAINFTPVAPITSVTYRGYSGVLKFDYCRGLLFSVATANTPNPITFTISGWDFWEHEVVEQVTIPSGSVPTFVITSLKTFSYIKSIYASAGSGAAVIGITTSAGFGLPYFLQSQNFAWLERNGHPDYSISLPNTPPNQDYYLSAPATSLRPLITNNSSLIVGDTTFPATATSGDPRGVYYVNPTFALEAAQIYFSLEMYCPAFDPSYKTTLSPYISAPSTAYAYGFPQYTTGWQ